MPTSLPFLRNQSFPFLPPLSAVPELTENVMFTQNTLFQNFKSEKFVEKLFFSLAAEDKRKICPETYNLNSAALHCVIYSRRLSKRFWPFVSYTTTPFRLFP